MAVAKSPKPDVYRSIPHREILALILAGEAGINATKGNPQMVGSLPVALIQRHDRVCEERISILPAMSLLKLQEGDRTGYADIEECIHMYYLSPMNDRHELWRRIVFGAMISDLDNHLRSNGFPYAGTPQWCLSPAYGLNPMPGYKKACELGPCISVEGPSADLDSNSGQPPILRSNQVQRKVLWLRLR